MSGDGESVAPRARLMPKRLKPVQMSETNFAQRS